MDFNLRIPLEFIDPRTNLSWRDVLFGLEQGLSAPSVASELAARHVAELPHPSPTLLELAGSSPEEATRALVQELVANEDAENEERTRAKWLYLALAWVYDQRDSISDPLSIVESLYADFDYPEEVSSFVRYMPMIGPDLGTREANEQRLLRNWRDYLERAAADFAKHDNAPDADLSR